MPNLEKRIHISTYIRKAVESNTYLVTVPFSEQPFVWVDLFSSRQRFEHWVRIVATGRSQQVVAAMDGRRLMMLVTNDYHNNSPTVSIKWNNSRLLLSMVVVAVQGQQPWTLLSAAGCSLGGDRLPATTSSRRCDDRMFRCEKWHAGTLCTHS